MSRPRAKADEAYVKKTVSIPPGVWSKVEEHLASKPYETLSRLVTDALHTYLEDRK